MSVLFISSNIKDQIRIGNNVIIGMGSLILQNIPDNQMWYGAPAKQIKQLWNSIAIIVVLGGGIYGLYTAFLSQREVTVAVIDIDQISSLEHQWSIKPASTMAYITQEVKNSKHNTKI